MLMHDNSIFDPLRESGLKRIALLKASISKTIPEGNNDKGLLCGHRWGDDNRIFYTACGMAIEHVNKEANKPHYESNESLALEYMQSLNQQDIDQLYIKAMLDAASCDHWYTYEKDWG
jgi:hypothetical protein